MMIATVITCPQRWEHYQRFLRNWKEAGFTIPIRTFQTKEAEGNAFANNNLNARAALAYGERHLPEGGWLLYLEDDVRISEELAPLLEKLMRVGNLGKVDCWYLCNRKNPILRRTVVYGWHVNELAWPMAGAHGLLIPKRHLATLLATHWNKVSDLSMFEAIRKPDLKIWQVVSPVLVEHEGAVSTYAPDRGPQPLEINA